MRTTLDVPDELMKRVKTEALREGVTLKAWFVSRLRADLGKRVSDRPRDEAVRFRSRFSGSFEPDEMDQLKRAGRA